ncbi:MAG: sulfotransferase, partial [Candidatus Peregrinibacteria bacterium]|nr:sulfotransferase [Candidatus Peregrinibacteria bacterium]
MLPNFFIAGAPKSGTTTLYRYLDEHRDVFMSPIKEPNFFSYDQIVEQNLYYPDKGVGSRDAYENLFKKVTKEKAIGEASVSYFFYDQVPSKIRSSIPDAKIILILRNPTARSFSHYLMDFRLGYVDTLFEDIVYKQIDCPLLDLYYQQFVELGFYYEHVKKYFDVFGEANVKVILNEDLKDHMRQVF